MNNTKRSICFLNCLTIGVLWTRFVCEKLAFEAVIFISVVFNAPPKILFASIAVVKSRVVDSSSMVGISSEILLVDSSSVGSVVGSIAAELFSVDFSLVESAWVDTTEERRLVGFFSAAFFSDVLFFVGFFSTTFFSAVFVSIDFFSVGFFSVVFDLVDFCKDNLPEDDFLLVGPFPVRLSSG